MSIQAIYIPEVGRPIPKLVRASGFLEATAQAVFENRKALADCAAEKLMPMVNLSFDTSWQYRGSLAVKGRPYHYYQQIKGNDVAQHLWITEAPLPE